MTHEPTDQTTLHCPLCGTSPFRKRFTKKDRDFFRCQHCSLERQHPLPTFDELAAYYEASYNEGMYQEFAAAHRMKSMTARQRIQEIRRTVPLEGQWLDVGCANGIFVETVAQHGVEAEGIELSEHAVQQGCQRNLRLHCGSIESFSTNSRYDCITAFDILEHVLDPNSFLDSIHARLADQGHVVLTVPNTGGIVRRLMGSRWYFYIPEEHLHYFNANNLSRLLEKHEFEVINVGPTYKPMTVDYALTQFAVFNPWIYRLLRLFSNVLPAMLRQRPVPLPIGELRIIGRKKS